MNQTKHLTRLVNKALKSGCTFNHNELTIFIDYHQQQLADEKFIQTLVTNYGYRIQTEIR